MAELENLRHERFCLEYVKDLNATRAYVDAGYSPGGASQAAHNLLRKSEVQERIAELVREHSDRLRVDATRVLDEYARVAFSDILSVVSVKDGAVAVKPSEEWTENEARAVAEVKTTATGKLTLKMHSKLDALGKLAQHLGLLREHIDLTSGGKPLAAAPTTVNILLTKAGDDDGAE